MASILHQPTSKALRSAFVNYINTELMGKAYANKHVRLQSDVLLSIGWKQAAVYPMMAIELPVNSIIMPDEHNTSLRSLDPVFAD
jgi:hypothetical protein